MGIPAAVSVQVHTHGPFEKVASVCQELASLLVDLMVDLVNYLLVCAHVLFDSRIQVSRPDDCIESDLNKLRQGLKEDFVLASEAKSLYDGSSLSSFVLSVLQNVHEVDRLWSLI